MSSDDGGQQALSAAFHWYGENQLMLEMLAILVAAGLVGGATAWLYDRDSYLTAAKLSTDSQIEAGAPPSVYSYLAGGLVASFAVPLFLRLTSSDLVDRVLDQPGSNPALSDPWVLAGFCLISAFSSKAFMQSLSRRILAMAQEAKREASEAKRQSQGNQEQIDSVAEYVENEPDPKVAEGSKAPAPRTEISLDEGERRVLTALVDGQYKWRTVSRMATELKLQRRRVSSIAEALVKKGLAIEKTSTKTGNILYSAADS